VATRKLKLFVWEDSLKDYKSGIMFALAHDVEEARQLICPGWTPDRRGYVEDDLRQEPRVVDRPEGFAVYGGG
jgi:hypothetical protein